VCLRLASATPASRNGRQTSPGAATMAAPRLPGARAIGWLLLLLSSGCQTPLAGAASQAVLGRLPTLAMTEADEVQLGVESYRELLSSAARTKHAEYQQLVERVGRRIAAVAGRDDYPWEFQVLAGDTKNAFCLPGGQVAVYEGLLPLCGNEAGLAVVMSHEIAHALARHGGERMKEQAVIDAVGDVINASAKDQSERRRMWIQQVYGGASQVGVLLPFSRTHELEADSIGLMLMARCSGAALLPPGPPVGSNCSRRIPATSAGPRRLRICCRRPRSCTRLPPSNSGRAR
jgi:predicted Zn-dependent protease